MRPREGGGARLSPLHFPGECPAHAQEVTLGDAGPTRYSPGGASAPAPSVCLTGCLWIRVWEGEQDPREQQWGGMPAAGRSPSVLMGSRALAWICHDRLPGQLGGPLCDPAFTGRCPVSRGTRPPGLLGWERPRSTLLGDCSLLADPEELFGRR